MKYKATMGTTATVITVVISALLGCLVAFFIYRMALTTAIAEVIIASVVIVFILSLFLMAYLHRPIHYLVDPEKLTIKRPIKDVVISMNEITDAFIVRKESMTWTERLGGNGGFFGFYGNFKNHFGMMTWYATKLKNYIMIETTRQGRIIITPDNTGLVKEIRKLIGK